MERVSSFVQALARSLSKPTEKPREGCRVLAPIVVSRDIGSGGRLVAMALAERLGFQLCGKAILEEMASRNHVPQDLIDLLDERPGRALELFGATLLRGVSMSTEDYSRMLKATIRALLDLGSVVVLGRGAVFLAKPGTALRLKIVAPVEMRIRNYAGYEKIDERTAARRLHEIDLERQKFFKSVYGHHEVGPECFDLAINMECLSIDQAVDLALDGYRKVCKCHAKVVA